MVSVDPQAKGFYYEDSNSSLYAGTSKDYGAIQEVSTPDRNHYVQVQSKLIEWYGSLLRNGVDSKDGALAVCGPGFRVDETDLSPMIIKSTTQHHPQVIGADWSPEILTDFYTRLTQSSRMLENRTELTRRDFSGGLSSKFQLMLMTKIEDVTNKQQLMDLMKWIKNEVGVTEVQKHSPAISRVSDAFNRRVKGVLNIDEPLNFDSILQGRAEVRFLTGNMLLTGMFALTEYEFREKIYQLQMDSSDRLSEQELVDVLREWHRLILELNNKVATDFVMQGLEFNKGAHMFLPSDLDSQYEGLDGFSRLDVDALRKTVEGRGYKLQRGHSWTADHTHEWPPHTHHMATLMACRNGKSTESVPETELAASADVSVPPAPSANMNGSSDAPHPDVHIEDIEVQ